MRTSQSRRQSSSLAQVAAPATSQGASPHSTLWKTGTARRGCQELRQGGCQGWVRDPGVILYTGEAVACCDPHLHAVFCLP